IGEDSSIVIRHLVSIQLTQDAIDPYDDIGEAWSFVWRVLPSIANELRVLGQTIVWKWRTLSGAKHFFELGHECDGLEVLFLRQQFVQDHSERVHVSCSGIFFVLQNFKRQPN